MFQTITFSIYAKFLVYSLSGESNLRQTFPLQKKKKTPRPPKQHDSLENHVILSKGPGEIELLK